MITLRKLVYFHPDAVIDTCLFVSEFIQNNFDENTRCDEAICPCPGRDSDGNCVIPDDGMVTCTYRDSNGTEHDITCAWKG